MAPLHLLLHCATTLLIANALLTPQLPGTESDGKSKGGFPFALDEDVDGVELPLEVDQDMTSDQASGRTQHSMPPAWLTFDPEPAPPTKHRSSHKPQTIIKHPTSSGFHKLSAHGHRSCHVEVVKEVQGICQSMPIGSACVTDDYMAVYTDANCSAQ